MTIIQLLNYLIQIGLLTPTEAQICLMTGGLMPDGIKERIEKLESESL
ncbi:MAG: hypothetical protein WCS03_04710 [Bacteroidota bacterium]